MIKVLMERELPAGFDVTDDDQAAWHSRVAVDAAAASDGRMHWLCTYATEDRKLFGVVAVEDMHAIEEYLKRAGIASQVKIRRVLRVLDPSNAGPPGMANPKQAMGRKS
jgi:hypothetical protein